MINHQRETPPDAPDVLPKLKDKFTKNRFVAIGFGAMFAVCESLVGRVSSCLNRNRKTDASK